MGADADGALWAYVSGAFKDVYGTTAHVQRIESYLAAGVPDLEWCARGLTGWIELKVQEGNRVKMRPEQVAWMHRRVRAGGRCHILVLGEKDEILCYHGRQAPQLAEQGLFLKAECGLWHLSDKNRNTKLIEVIGGILPV